MEAQIEVGPEEILREDPIVTDTQDDPLQISDLPDQDPALPVPSSLPNLVHEAIQPPGQEQVALQEPPTQGLRRSSRIRKPSRAMLEHLAAHSAKDCLSETCVVIFYHMRKEPRIRTSTASVREILPRADSSV